MKPEHVRARLDCSVDVVATREAADLDERPREDLVQAAPQDHRARISAEPIENRIGACELGRCSLRA